MTGRRFILIFLACFMVGGIAWVAWWYFKPGGAYITPSRDEFPIRGVDISAHNGTIDFRQMTADSIDFVLIKATEGTAFKDPAFHSNYLRAKREGMRVGAYHFFRFDASGYMQALNFLHSVRGKNLDLPLVIDVEEWTNPTDRTTQTIITQLRDLIDNLEHAGYDVMIYTNKDGYERFVKRNFERYPLWIASLRGQPESDWYLWQYTHSGRTSGAPSDIDINTFNGSREDWENWMSESAR